MFTNTRGKNTIFVVMAASEFLSKNQTNGRRIRWESFHTYDKNESRFLLELDNQDILTLKWPKGKVVHNIFCMTRSSIVILLILTLPFLFHDRIFSLIQKVN